MNLLEMNHVSKKFDGLEVLKDISIQVKKGEVISIIGPSGSGKSTILRCATMLETIDSGELIYLNRKAAWNENGKAVYAPHKELKEIHGDLNRLEEYLDRLQSMDISYAKPHIYKRKGPAFSRIKNPII